jgi:hypothetical protein
MNDREEQMGEIIVTTNNKQVQGITTIEPEVIRKFPGNAGIENISLPGVNSNNELSTHMLFEVELHENLVYVNEIRNLSSFLIIRSGQEGLSFTNTDLVQNVEFSAGGFKQIWR